jgi:hypothetical protein
MNGIYWNDILKVTYLFYLTNYKLQLKKQQQRDQKLSQQPWSTRNIFEKKKTKTGQVQGGLARVRLCT